MFKKKPEKTDEEIRYSKEAIEKIRATHNKEVDKYIQDAEIEIIPYETFKVYDMANMFPWNITPALYESKLAHAVAAKQRMFNSVNPQMAFIIIAVLIGGVIAAVIAWKFLTKDAATPCNCICDIARGVITAASSNMTG